MNNPKNKTCYFDEYPIIEECETVADCFAQIGIDFFDDVEEEQ